MPDDLWYLKKRGEDGKRLKSKRYGRGRRWRVRWIDPESGEPRSELFDKLTEAETAEANVRADVSRGQYIDPRAGQITVTEYAEAWRKDHVSRWSTANRIEGEFRLHILPVIGHLPMNGVRPSHIRGWVKGALDDLSPSSLGVVYTDMAAMFSTAVLDKVIGSTPCVGIRLPEVISTDKVILSAKQVHAVAEALPAQYRAMVFVAAGCGLRPSEVYGLELSNVQFLKRLVQVRQQLVKSPGADAYLGQLKTKQSRADVDMAEVVANEISRHLKEHGTTTVEIWDRTNPKKEHIRQAELLFAKDDKPLTRSKWSQIWPKAVKAAGLPKGTGFHDLRHYFATTLIFGGANVKSVQLALRHASPVTTLNEYVGLWPDALETTRGLVQSSLGRSGDGRAHAAVIE